MRARALTFLLGAAVFFFGAIAGGLATRAVDLRVAGEWLRQPPAERRALLLERVLARRLDLDDAQAEHMNGLIRSQRQQVEAINAETADARSRLRHQLLDGSSNVLRPAQRRELERLLELADRREGGGP